MDSEFLAGLGGDPADEQAAYVQHAEPAPASEAYDNLWIVENDRIWDLGPADVDTDADGIADSLTRPGPDGLTVYTDSDRDGQVDLITEVRKDGGFTSQRLDPSSGEWIATDSGRLG
ncbi:DUF6802 family protein [Williamsia sp. 1135]|uniref:DUF6802 family protein n=1 Tax=Williamsia sp. 1135 TaxID=1889262 RepID=UPI000A107A0A|nr:DUF6802 family protein [Williamsia sp. 1135]ORM35344.1 hypothetical protein BFL43_09820 [Williamsia sp. 1135]